MPTNQQILLATRPPVGGDASTSNFKLVSEPTPELKDGELLVRHHYLSLDPYMRLRMDDAKSYTECHVRPALRKAGRCCERMCSQQAPHICSPDS